ncbi:hypothetical protein [Stenotrophomonas sp. PS02298]|uniref:hypothetical protein n=1 Tax=Stenotrophomonas sp. PS02298 TaxID=2991424 RepID=UPI00249BCED4|nr:hypothetical protein [Stenotrophomonas sp. PS02298]
MKQMKLLRSLAADCRDHGEHDVARGIEGVANDVAELCEAIKAERAASDKGDSIAYLEARLRTTLVLTKFEQANSHGAGDTP